MSEEVKKNNNYSADSYSSAGGNGARTYASFNVYW